MKNVFLNEEVLPAEKAIIKLLNIPPLVLMENAGSNSARYIVSKNPVTSSEVIILSGKGNNAGDGFVIARHLVNAGLNVKVILLFPEKEISKEASVNFTILKKINDKKLKVIYCKDSKSVRAEVPDETGLLIDAVFGVGFKGKPDHRIESVFRLINGLKKKKVISLDVPSGLYNFIQDTVCIKASETFSMGVKKFETLFYGGKESSGDVSIIDIGISGNIFTEYNRKKIFQCDSEDIKKFLPVRKTNSNKYSNGKVLILSGSPGYTGAAFLCSQSALRTGSGAVITAFPKSIAGIIEKKLTEVIKMSLDETPESSLSLKSYGKIKQKLNWADSVLIGPGISKNEETLELVRKIVEENNLNFVIDADAISAFKNNFNLFKGKKIILTPHFGEFANLTGKSPEQVKRNFYELSRTFAKKNKIVLVLKNSPSIITDGDFFYINTTGRENLATAGTGDVLAGIIASLVSRNKNLLESALAGVYIHGRCGDNLFDKTGPESTIAGDLIREIPKVKNQILKS